jgi:hypothetical protein
MEQSTVSFKSKILDFGSLFGTINENDEITVYSELGKKTYIIKTKDTDKIVLISVDDINDTTIWEKEGFLNNIYNIYDIVITGDFVFDVSAQRFNVPISELNENLLGFETYYIEKYDWEKIFPIQEQRDDIFHSLIKDMTAPSINLIAKMNAKANSFVDLIELYQKRDYITKEFIQDVRKTSCEIPELDFLKSHQFRSNIIFPIISDAKYIYNDGELFIDDDDIRKIYYDPETYSDNYDVIQLSQLEEINILYAGFKSADITPNRLSFNDAKRIEYFGGELPEIVTRYKKGKLSTEVMPIYTAYKPVVSNNNYFKFNANTSFFGYRNITPSYPFEISEKFSNKIMFQNRYVRGTLHHLVDNPDITNINKNPNCVVCQGTPKTGEHIYHSDKDPYVKPGKDFNLSISKEPSEVSYLKGEDVILIGFLLRSPYYINPDFNTLNKKQFNLEKYILEHYGGYLNIIERYFFNKNRPLNELFVNEIDYNGNYLDDIDYRKDNFIKFNISSQTEYLAEDYNNILKNVVLDQNKVLQIESENIEKINNITDLNKILSNYFLNVRNLNEQNFQKIKTILEKRYDLFKQSISTEEERNKFYQKLNSSLELSLSNLYQTLFTIDSSHKLDVAIISKLLHEMFRKEDRQVIQHLLKYYFYVDSDFISLDDAIILLTKCIYDRYYNYLCNDSAFRIIFHPTHTIQNPQISSLIADLNSFYDIKQISIHTPTRIGVLNELLHTLSIKDRSIHFDILIQYLHALNGLNKLVIEENIWNEKYKSIEGIQLQIKVDEDNIKQIISENHLACMKLRLSKIYLSLTQLEMDNGKTDLELDPFLDISVTLKSIFSKLLSKRSQLNPQEFKELLQKNIITQFSFETTAWIEETTNILIAQNGNLDKTFIGENQWALLIDTDLDYYRLYRRNNNIWVFNSSVPESERIAPIIKQGKLVNTPKNNLKFSSLCNLEGVTSREMKSIAGLMDFILDDDTSDLNREIGKKCVIHDGICVSKIIADIDKNIQYNRHALKTKRYIDEQKINLQDLLLNLQPKIFRLQKQINEMKDKKFERIFQLQQNLFHPTKEISQYDKLLKHYKDQFAVIKNISDDDIRLTEIEKFIMLHGLFDRDIKDGKLIRVPIEESHFIYWDIQNIAEKMCCKHWLVLTKQAYKSNLERSKLQKQLELNWGEELHNSRYIYCKNCDIAIGLSRESDNEGFDADDRLIQLREAVKETSINELLEKIEAETSEDLSNLSVEIDGKDLKILNDLIIDPKIDIPYHDKKELLLNVSEFLKKDNVLDVYHFEAELITKDQTNIEGLKPMFNRLADGKSGIEKYRDLRDKIFPRPRGYVLTESDISSIANQKPPNQLHVIFTKMIKGVYEKEYNFKRVTYLAARLVASLIIAEPEYKITGSSERSTGQAIYSNFISRPDLAVKMVSDKLYNLLSNSHDEIYTTSNAYLIQISPKVGKSPKDNLQEEINKIYANYISIPLLSNKIKEKFGRITKNKQVLIDKIKNSLEWKTFRPYLKISENIDGHLGKLDGQLKIVHTEIKRGDKYKEKYYSYLLSNKLFYSIQKIVQLSEPMIKNSFTNFCCLTSPRSAYIEHFTTIDDNIRLTLSEMNSIQSTVFYNPHQNLYLLFGNQMNIVTPNLLNYINEQSPLSDIEEVNKRIKKLITTYTLLDDETTILGKKRLFSYYYDKYLNDVKKLDRDALLAKITTENPHIQSTSINLRHKNLYSIRSGLIMHDTVSNKYIWDIENEILTLLSEKTHAQLLDIYYNLLSKLYLSSSLHLSRKQITRVPLYYNNSSVIQQYLEQHETISKCLHQLQQNIRDNYNADLDLVSSGMPSFEEYNNVYYANLNLCIQKFDKLPDILHKFYADEIAKSHSNILTLVKNKTVKTYEEGIIVEQERVRNEIITKNDREYREIWKEILLEIPKLTDTLDKVLKIPSEQKCWINNLSVLNGHRDILKEIKEKIPNQILIEGYSDEFIASEMEIRNKFVDNKFRSRNLDTMKKYYAIIQNQISRFKYFKMDCGFNIVNRKRIMNKNLDKNTEFDFEYNSFHLKKFFSNDIYEQIDKNNINTPVDCNIINNLMSIETNNMTIKGMRSTEDYLIQIVSFLTQTELLKFMDKNTNRLYYAEYCYEFIWKNNIEKLEILNMMSEKDVKTHLRNILASENKNRLAKFKELSESKKILHKLKRDLGLGNLSVPDDEKEHDAVQDENEIIQEIEEQYNAGDLIAQDKMMHQNETHTNARIDLLLGADADEGARQMAREFLENQDAEDNAAAIEFGMSGVRNENDDDDNEEILDD